MKSRIFFAIAVIIFFASCTKSTPETKTIINYDTTYIITHDTVLYVPPVNPIVGLWVGYITAVNEPLSGTLYYSIDLRSDSTILTQSLGADGTTYYSQGTWTLYGNNFTASITSTSAFNKGTQQTLTAIYTKTAGTIIGNWQNVAGNASGTLTLRRVN